MLIEDCTNTISGAEDDSPTVDVTMVCEVSQETPDSPLRAVLTREETRQWSDDPTPDVIETIVSETLLRQPVPDVLAAVDRWLLAVHHLRVAPTSWEPGATGADTGVVLLLQGRAEPAPAAAYAA
ncbi:MULTISPECIES: hypothetical protein [Mycolicibacter]|uniref:Uncharacterized protein n=2 Tax=Mycolicibacter TaxID=1073531 RepID=A0ABU5XPU0_9MYCO|nr:MULTISPECIES: hypothetical protein [unclassified Mycolicibacter]MEB3023342.1 hypothetical protein [Mycolicibacter sp. MYC098]MEB3035122.1 hypothetical protein [Mycolicibacter sp. MYC340]